MTAFEQAQADIKAAEQKIERYRLAFIPLMAGSCVLLLIHPFACIAGLIFSLYWQGHLFRKGRRAFSDAYNHNRVLMGLEGDLTGITHTHNGGLDRAVLERGRLIALPQQGGIRQMEFTTGEGKGFAVQMAEVSSACRYTSGGSSHVDPVVGTWIHIDLQKDSGVDWRLVQKGMMNDLNRRSYFNTQTDLEKAELDEEDLNNRYHFYRKAGSDVTPPANLRRQLRALQNATAAKIAVGVNGSSLDCFLHNRMICFNAPYVRDITEKMLRDNPTPELEYVLRMAALLQDEL